MALSSPSGATICYYLLNRPDYILDLREVDRLGSVLACNEVEAMRNAVDRDDPTGPHNLRPLINQSTDRLKSCGHL